MRSGPAHACYSVSLSAALCSKSTGPVYHLCSSLACECMRDLLHQGMIQYSLIDAIPIASDASCHFWHLPLHHRCALHIAPCPQLASCSLFVSLAHVFTSISERMVRKLPLHGTRLMLCGMQGQGATSHAQKHTAAACGAGLLLHSSHRVRVCHLLHQILAA